MWIILIPLKAELTLWVLGVDWRVLKKYADDSGMLSKLKFDKLDQRDESNFWKLETKKAKQIGKKIASIMKSTDL